MNNTIRELLKRPIAYQPIVAKAFDSVTLAILWCQFYYWSDKTNDPDGWVYKTRQDIFDETGLGRKQQETAREKGAILGVLESQRRGPMGIVHFRINFDKAFEIIEEYAENNKEKIQEEKQPKVERRTGSMEWLKAIPQDEMQELCLKYRVSEAFIKARAVDVIDYCQAHGKKYADYKAALRNFIKSHKGPKEEYRPRIDPLPVEKEQTPEQKAKAQEVMKNIREKFVIKSIPK